MILEAIKSALDDKKGALTLIITAIILCLGGIYSFLDARVTKVENNEIESLKERFELEIRIKTLETLHDKE